MKARKGSIIVEKNRSRITIEKNKERRHVEYSTIGCKVVLAFIIIFGMCKMKNVRWKDVICTNDIYRTRASSIAFLCKSKSNWRARKQTWLRATYVDSMFIEELEEDKVMEQHFVETHVAFELNSHNKT